MPPRKRARATRAKHLNWGMMTIMTATLERADGTALVVMVAENRSGWSVLAVASTKKVKSAHAFLDNHAHEVIAEDLPNQFVAVRRAETYARRWKQSSVKKTKCACKEIDMARLPAAA